jgi:hypothetical protein
MKKRTSSLPVLVLVAVVALVLGSFGTATAAGLTKGSVKKIATKVVKKQAPSLSVAHATSADTATTAATATNATNATNAANATQLSGKPATAYQNPSTTYVLPVQAAASSRTYTLNGVAPGTYLAAYSVFMQLGVAGESDCQIWPTGAGTPIEGWTYGQAHSVFNSQAATAIITVGAAAPKLFCEGSTTWSIFAGTNPVSRVTLTKVDTATTVGTTGAKADSSDSAAGLNE